jgi:hypothetical protein
MVTQDFHLYPGMEVFDTNGEKIGTVVDVYSDRTVEGIDAGITQSTEAASEAAAGQDVSTTDDPILSGQATTPPASVTSTTSAAPTTGAEATGAAYFRVDHGGFLGIGAKHLYVPFSAISAVVPEENVTLSVTKDDAAQQFAEEPAELQS